MEKVTLDIPRNEDGKWGSYISKYPADSGKVPHNAFTKDSRNIVTSVTGNADKRSGGAIWNPNSLLSGAALDQYEGIFPSGTRLFIVNDAGTLKASTGNGVFTSITAGFTNPANFEFATYQGRVYGCNGVDAAIVMDTATAYGGVNYVFTTAKTKLMGAQAPGSACTATRNTDSTANQIGAGSHTYKITFVYYNGVEESNGSAASSVCVNDSTHTSNALTSIPVGGYGVTARNIYRDNNDGVYVLLATISNNTATTYTDILPVGSTPTPIPTANFAPGIFKYIALYLDRLFTIDVTGKTIAWSKAGQPDIFDPANTISGPQDDVMTAIVIFNGIPWVFGQHTVGTILGTDDGSFYYNPVSTKVGCVDNRSIQTREIISVPTLLWLAATPNKGIYYTNGSVVQYLSEFIEDLTFNLAQISYLQRQNTQSSQADFQGGTSSPGIDLTTNPGEISTINPVASFSHAADWAAGVLSNIAVSGDQLMVPVGKAFTYASGAVGGSAQISGGNLTLPGGGSFTGESHGDQGTTNWINDAVNTRYFANKIAQSFVPTLTGTLNVISGITFRAYWANSSGSWTLTISVYSDSGGLPGSALASTTQSFPTLFDTDQSISPATLNVSLTGGTKYWIVLAITPKSNDGQFSAFHFSSGWSSGQNVIGSNLGGIWSTVTPPQAPTPRMLAGAYTFTITPVAESGSWTSPVYDSLCTTQTSGMALAVAATLPTHTSMSILVQGSADQSAWTTTDTVTAGGTTSLTGGQYRYWRLVMTISTTDSRDVPVINPPTLTFNVTGTWTSAPILCTTDITTLDALVDSSSIPAGTTMTITIATSATIGSGYSSFTAVGLATPNKYAKIRVVMTTDGSNMTSPTLLTAELDWSLSSNLVSSAIDTGVTPAGWGIFQWGNIGTGGTITFYFRSASTALGLASASFAPVTNGGFPTASPLEFCQWKVVLTASANSVAEIDSVTVNWLLTSGANVRAASLFFNKSYYLAVAIQGQTKNNVLIELDYEGNWRVHSGINIGAMALYFNDAFNCDSNNGNVYNMFKLDTDNGTPIVFDMRTKCFVFGDDEHLSIARSVRVKGVNTGTTIHVYYSVDKGSTWCEMLNSSGALGYTTTNDLSTFNEYFVVNFNGGNPVAGTGIIYRVVSSDQYACSIQKIKPTAYIRKGKVVTEAMA